MMEALEQVKAVGLKHLLPGKQAARHAEKGVAEQRGVAIRLVPFCACRALQGLGMPCPRE